MSKVKILFTILFCLAFSLNSYADSTPSGTWMTNGAKIQHDFATTGTWTYYVPYNETITFSFDRQEGYVIILIRNTSWGILCGQNGYSENTNHTNYSTSLVGSVDKQTTIPLYTAWNTFCAVGKDGYIKITTGKTDAGKTLYLLSNQMNDLFQTTDGSKIIVKIVAARYDYTLNFDANGGSVDPTSYTADGLTGAGNATHTFTDFPTPTRTGYIFSGWYDSASGGNLVTSTTLTGKINQRVSSTVYAHWTPIKYNVKFNANGGIGSPMTNQQFTYDQAQALSGNTYSKPGYLFDGWALNAEGTGTKYSDKKSVSNLSATDGAVVNLYATWTRNKYWIKATNLSHATATPDTQADIVFENACSDIVIKAAKNYALSSITVTTDLDGTVTSSKTDLSPVVSTYTYNSQPVLGNTTLTVTTVRVSADVTITRNDLQKQDCSIITISKQGDSGVHYSVLLTPSNKSVVLNSLPCGTYDIEESGWAFSYNKASKSVLKIQPTDANNPTVELSGAKKPQSLLIHEQHESNNY